MLLIYVNIYALGAIIKSSEREEEKKGGARPRVISGRFITSSNSANAKPLSRIG